MMVKVSDPIAVVTPPRKKERHPNRRQILREQLGSLGMVPPRTLLPEPRIPGATRKIPTLSGLKQQANTTQSIHGSGLSQGGPRTSPCWPC
jgi:hypothetical protein